MEGKYFYLFRVCNTWRSKVLTSDVESKIPAPFKKTLKSISRNCLENG